MELTSKDYANFAKTSILEQWDYFPDDVYENLPRILKDFCAIFTEKRERDIFLAGSLSVLGGCYHNLIAYNSVDKRGISTNLFVFVVAPPASGKRAIQYSRSYLDKIAQTYNLHSIYTEARKSRRLIIPANNSLAGVLQMLEKNDGAGIIIESEIDTILNSFRQEWGNYSDVIRNAFENEFYSLYRKTGSELIEIERLQLSMALSGTTSQFKALLGSVDNGLFSRGCYYIFENLETELKSFGRFQTEIELDKKLAEFATLADNYYRAAESFQKVKVVFSEEYMNCIQTALQVVFDFTLEAEERGFEANVKRAFSVTLKIATLFTYLEACEVGNLQSEFQCTHKALIASLAITLIFMNHGHKAYKVLATNNYINLNMSEQRLFYMLPSEFIKAEALAIAQEIGLKERTAYNAVKGLEKKGWVLLKEDGFFRKNVL